MGLCPFIAKEVETHAMGGSVADLKRIPILQR